MRRHSLRLNELVALLAGAVLIALLGTRLRSASRLEAVITVNKDRTYQTITGWEATAQAGQWEFLTLFPRYKDTLFDLAVNDLGINRLRVEFYSGAENPVDYFAQYLAGQLPFDQFETHFQDAVNDNSDPYVINPAGFQFTFLDYDIDNVVLPMKQRLEARGEHLFINVNYIDMRVSPFEHWSNPEEYAELVLATYQHLQAKYGWTPDAWEVVLEPEHNPGWTPRRMGEAVAAAAARLQAHGYTPHFIAPSTTNMNNASSFFDTMIEVPGVLPYLTELSYHRYGGVSDANLRAISSRAVQYHLNTAMLEHIGSDYQDLHEDLKTGRNSAWQQYTLGYPGTDDGGGAYYLINDSDPTNPRVNLSNRARFLRQYFKYVRAGAMRIEATATTIDFDPLAFINTDGKYVVVVKAIDRGDFSVQGLPPGVYGIKYTTAHEYDVNLSDVNLAAGQALSAHMPEPGVMTIYAKAAPVAEATPTRTPIPTLTRTPPPTFTRTPPPTPSITPTVRTPTDEDYFFYLPYILSAAEPPDWLAAPGSQTLPPCGEHS